MSTRESLYSPGENNISAYTLASMSERQAQKKGQVQINGTSTFLNPNQTINVYNTKTGRSGTISVTESISPAASSDTQTTEAKPIFTVAKGMELQGKTIDLTKANDVTFYRKGGEIVGISEPNLGSRAISTLPGYKPGMVLTEESALQYRKEVAASRTITPLPPEIITVNQKSTGLRMYEDFKASSSQTTGNIRAAFLGGINAHVTPAKELGTTLSKVPILKGAGGAALNLYSIAKIQTKQAILNPANIFYWPAKLELSKMESMPKDNNASIWRQKGALGKEFLLKLSTKAQERIATKPAESALLIGSGALYQTGMGLLSASRPVAAKVLNLGVSSLFVASAGSELIQSKDRVGTLAEGAITLGLFNIGQRLVMPSPIQEVTLTKTKYSTKDYLIKSSKTSYSSGISDTKLTKRSTLDIGGVKLAQRTQVLYGTMPSKGYSFLKTTRTYGNFKLETMWRKEPLTQTPLLDYLPGRDITPSRPGPLTEPGSPAMSGWGVWGRGNLLPTASTQNQISTRNYPALSYSKPKYASIFGGGTLSIYSESTGEKLLEIIQKPKKPNPFKQTYTSSPSITTGQSEHLTGSGQILITKQKTKTVTLQKQKIETTQKSKLILIPKQITQTKQSTKLKTEFGIKSEFALLRKQALKQNQLWGSMGLLMSKTILGQQQKQAQAQAFITPQRTKQKLELTLKPKQVQKQKRVFVFKSSQRLTPNVITIQTTNQALKYDFKFSEPNPPKPIIKVKPDIIEFPLYGSLLKFGGMNLKRTTSSSITTSKKSYTPSLEASYFRIKGKPNKIMTESGLGIRPIPG